MHPRNRYGHGQLDYDELVKLVPELAKHLRHTKETTMVDFSVGQTPMLMGAFASCTGWLTALFHLLRMRKPLGP